MAEASTYHSGTCASLKQHTKEKIMSNLNTKGFTDESNPDLDAFINLEANARAELPVKGNIVGHFQIKDREGKTRDVIVLKVIDEVFGAKKGDEEASKYPKGSIMGLNVSHNLQGIMPYVEKRGAVMFQPIKTVSIGNGKKTWTFEGPYCRGEKAELVVIRKVQSQAQAAMDFDNDDVPF